MDYLLFEGMNIKLTSKKEHNQSFKDPSGIPITKIYIYIYISIYMYEIENIVQELLAIGSIRNSQSTFASPIVLVRKADSA